jgi:hypothetical protein
VKPRSRETVNLGDLPGSGSLSWEVSENPTFQAVLELPQFS